MNKNRFETHQSLDVEQYVSSLERSFIRHQRFIAVLSVMIVATLIGIYYLLFAIMCELSELKFELSGLAVAIGELKKEVLELKETVLALSLYVCVRSVETDLQLNRAALPSQIHDYSSTTGKES